ncbi:MAG TPA: hypothetical protein VGV90_03210, partial [Solirubrobacteraceae bacterium]|nr:hypothetical protein [Solirubrobacteraceae bacterium]
MRFAPVFAVLIALVTLATPAAAGGAGSGGLRSGGAAFGDPLPIPDKRPVASRLTVTPREVIAGDPAPVVQLRVRQRGVVRVRARIVVVRLPGSRPVARKSLGRVRTGRALKVQLPKALKLQTGRYVVRLHVKDPRGRTLRRSGAHPGRARIVVRRPKAVPAPVLPGAPAPLMP